MSQEFCLKWKNHMNNMVDVFKNMLSTETLADVTLACDGMSLKAHKIVLSACSPFFQSLFLENPCKHPIVILTDMKYTELKAIVEFMYHGEVNVAQDQLSVLMKTAETLKVKGLTEETNEKHSNVDESSYRSESPANAPRLSKRKRGRTRKRSLSNPIDDGASEPKVNQADSDIEYLSGNETDAASQYSSVPSTKPIPNKSSQKQYRQREQMIDKIAHESLTQGEKIFAEPFIMQQESRADDLVRPGRSFVQSNVEMQKQSRSTYQCTDLVPVSMTSKAFVNQQLKIPPVIKSETVELESPMSPVSGASYSADENSKNLSALDMPRSSGNQEDQTSALDVPGSSNNQEDQTSVSDTPGPSSNQEDQMSVLDTPGPSSIQEDQSSVSDIPGPSNKNMALVPINSRSQGKYQLFN